MRPVLAAFDVSTPGSVFDLVDRSAKAVKSVIGYENDIRIGLGDDLGRLHPLHSGLVQGHFTAGELDHLAHAAAVTAAAFADDEIDIRHARPK